MNLWELLTTSAEERRRRGRESFAAGMAQPDVFQTENYPLAEMAKSYEKGFGIPYPQQHQPVPVAGAESQMGIQPTNMPLEYVKPRSPEEIAMRSAGIEGRFGAEKKVSGLQYYGQQMPRIEGFVEDVGGDIDEYDIPASLGGFQRPQMVEPGKSYGDPYYDPQVKALLQEEMGSGQVSRIAGAPAEGAGSGSAELDKIYDDALNTYKAIVAKAKLDPTTALMLQMMPDMAKNKEFMEGYVTPKLTPEELAQLQQAIQLMDHIQKQRRGGFNLGQIPAERDQEEAATAEDWMRKKGLR